MKYTGGTIFATSSVDKTARIWTFEGKLLSTLADHHESLGPIAFHPSGRLLITTSFDQAWRIWDLEKSQSLKSARESVNYQLKLLYEQVFMFKFIPLRISDILADWFYEIPF